MGDENHIYIVEDPWLNRKGSRFLYVVQDGLKGRRVSDLIKSPGEWDVDLIKRSFLPSDAEDILAIPIGNPPVKDEIIWALDFEGVLKVKSAYHLASKIQRANEASSSREVKQGTWGSIWNRKIILRAKICLWNVVNNIIPLK